MCNLTNLALSVSADPLAGYERYASPNWDGFGADPIARSTLEAARRFLRLLPSSLGAPDIAPGTDGTIGLEWSFADRRLRKLFIDIGPGNAWSGYWRLASGDRATLPQGQINDETASALTNLFDMLSG
jgi:hypothetical protein